MGGAVTLHAGDNIASMRSLPENSVDSIVTDPPYLLTSIVKRFGKQDSAAARTEGNDGSFARLSGGFMRKMWDSPNVEMPLLDADFANYMAGLIDGEGCFSVHKKTVNGCETYDCQFTISLREDDAPILVEMQRRLNGIGSIAYRPERGNANPQVRYCISSKADCQVLQLVLSMFPMRAKKLRDFEIWSHALDAWLNHEMGGSWEDISFYRDQLMLVKRYGSFYKPELLFHYRWAKEAHRVLKPGGYIFAFSGSRTGHWQAAAMEDAGFVMHPMHGWVYGNGFPKGHNPKLEGWEGWKHGTQTQKPSLEPIYLGQKPFSEKTCRENLIKHGVGAFNIDGCRVGDGGESRDRVHEAAMTRRYTDDGSTNFAALPGAARGGSPDGRYPSNLILDGSRDVIDLFPTTRSGAPGTIRKGTNDGAAYGAESRAPGTPMTGYGDEGSAARFFHQFPLTEADYQWAIDAGLIGTDLGDAIIYNAKASKQDRLGSKHPTVKPVALLQYLIRHITPPGGIVLDMFAGSGTTAEAARREGFDCILMEAEPEYLDFLCSRFVLNPEYAIGIDAYSTVNGARINSTVSKLDITNVANKELCLLDILGDLAAVEKREVQVPGTFRSYSGYDLTELLS